MHPEPTIRIFPDPEALAVAARDEFLHRAEAAIRDRGRFAVALSGGKTPVRLYRLLMETAVPVSDWRSIHFFWGDERPVSPEHPDSNYGNALDAFLSWIEIPAENLHPVPAGAGPPPAAAVAYEKELRRFFEPDGGEWPRFDLMLLGLGADGHTASLFPGSQALEEERRWVAAPHVEAMESDRITLTPPVFSHARCLLYLVAGGGKAAAVRQALEAEEPAKRGPTGRLGPRDGDLLWFLDAAAATRLSRAGV